MNKERLAQLALEVADTHSAPYASNESLIRFATRFLAAVDELRAKEAKPVAWRHTSEMVGSCVNTNNTQLSGWVTEPLYLHPQQEKDGWTSTNSGLPPLETEVVILLGERVCLGERIMEFPTYEESFVPDWYWDDPNDDGQGWERKDVTHWMPLPAAPEEKP